MSLKAVAVVCVDVLKFNCRLFGVATVRPSKQKMTAGSKRSNRMLENTQNVGKIHDC